MATSLVVEEECGTCTGYVHPHNGYYAGDFSFRTTQSVEVSATVVPFPPMTVQEPLGHSTAA